MKSSKPTIGTTRIIQPTPAPTRPETQTETKAVKPIRRVRIGKGSCGICD